MALVLAPSRVSGLDSAVNFKGKRGFRKFVGTKRHVDVPRCIGYWQSYCESSFPGKSDWPLVVISTHGGYRLRSSENELTAHTLMRRGQREFRGWLLLVPGVWRWQVMATLLWQFMCRFRSRPQIWTRGETTFCVQEYCLPSKAAMAGKCHTRRRSIRGATNGSW